MNKLNEIVFKYRKSFIVDDSILNRQKRSTKLSLILNGELSEFGYFMSKDLIDAFDKMTNEEFKVHAERLLVIAGKSKGAHKTYPKLFKNFPHNVPGEDFYFNRILNHFANILDIPIQDGKVFECGHIVDKNTFNIEDFAGCPICGFGTGEISDANLKPLTESVSGMMINLESRECLSEICSNLLSSKSSISKADKDTIDVILTEGLTINESKACIESANIVFKEIGVFVSNILVIRAKTAKMSVFETFETVKEFNSTATDVLRLASEISHSDGALLTTSRFRLKSFERNVILALLDNIEHPLEDMMRYRSRWIALGECLHPGTKKRRFPNAYSAFDIIRNNPASIETFASKVEKEYFDLYCGASRYSKQIVDLLKRRPGEFARRLDSIISNDLKNSERIIWEFNEVIDKVSNKVLISLIGHFSSRSECPKNRYFIPKGNVSNMIAIPNNRPILSREIVDSIVGISIRELASRYKDLGKMGPTYIDPILKNYLIPTSLRSANNSLNTIGRGSILEFPDSINVIRPFIWWKNGTSRVDIDLSVTFYTSDFDYMNKISYTNLKNEYSVHSGDITNAPNGAAEFVDINIDEALGHGVRYVAINVLSYSRQPFCDLPECFSGIQYRNNIDTGDTFEAKLVNNKFDLTGDTRYNVPIIFDLFTRRGYWADISLRTDGLPINVENQGASVENIIDMITNMHKSSVSIYDLITLHINSRNPGIVDIGEKDEGVEYEHVFDESFALKTDEILGKWM